MHYGGGRLTLNQNRIRWLIEFMEMKFSGLSNSKLNSVRKNIALFLRRSEEEITPGAFIGIETDDGALNLTIRKLEGLQNEVKQLIANLLDAKRVGTLFAKSESHPIYKKHGIGQWTKRIFLRPENLSAWKRGMHQSDQDLDINCKFHLLATPAGSAADPSKFTIQILGKGNTRDVFLFKLLNVLSQEFLGSIAICPSPICNNRMFLRTGKKSIAHLVVRKS